MIKTCDSCRNYGWPVCRRCLQIPGTDPSHWEAKNEYLEQTDWIQKKLPLIDLRLQLAEECAEACMAAIKLIRAEREINYTPVTLEQAEEDLLEELADIEACKEVMGFHTSEYQAKLNQIVQEKTGRWARRLGG